MNWLPIPNYEKYYSISEEGQIKRLVKRHSKPANALLAQWRDSIGYWRVSLTDEFGLVTTYPVHRLVALAFIGTCPEGQECHHKDHDKNNNHKDNLEYVTRAKNIKLSFASGTRKVARGERANSKLNKMQVLEIRESWRTEKPRPTYLKLAKRYGVTHVAIMNAIKRKSWKHLGG